MSAPGMYRWLGAIVAALALPAGDYEHRVWPRSTPPGPMKPKKVRPHKGSKAARKAGRAKK